jgi:hypothetical protein
MDESRIVRTGRTAVVVDLVVKTSVGQGGQLVA